MFEIANARAAFLALFPSAMAAEAFEAEVLSAGREFLPLEAQGVFDGGRPSAAYWRFMTAQAEAAADEMVEA